ncbi:uncharacterized protein MESR3 [Cloeon dipterum]|uniref:uncharacterized protein MESR3 n=1 Tax=Cloeon dipterum TaxID=197152 RepID=UPI00321FBF0E
MKKEKKSEKRWHLTTEMKSLVITSPNMNQYASCPQLVKGQTKAMPQETNELQAVKRFTAKYDSYQGLIQAASHRSDSPTSSEDEGKPATVTEQERMQTESFFRGLKTQVYVSSTLANLYFGTATHAPSGGNASPAEWELMYTGIPVVILDLGETRSRRKRRIQILLAERGSCFTLWKDTIDNLTSYKQVAASFHTMYLSSDHRRVVGLSFDSADAADELLAQIEALTSRPENISLSVPKGVRPAPTPSPPKRLPPKSQISQPCCFQHVTSVGVDDRSRYFSLQTLVDSLPPPVQPEEQ